MLCLWSSCQIIHYINHYPGGFQQTSHLRIWRFCSHRVYRQYRYCHQKYFSWSHHTTSLSNDSLNCRELIERVVMLWYLTMAISCITPHIRLSQTFFCDSLSIYCEYGPPPDTTSVMMIHTFQLPLIIPLIINTRIYTQVTPPDTKAVLRTSVATILHE